MRKWLLLLPAVLLVSVVLLVLGTGNASIEAVNACGDDPGAGVAPAGLGELGSIEGPVGGPVTGSVGMAQANIPRRSGLDGFRASMPRVLSTGPDFVTLNEASGWTLDQIEAAAAGYDAYRDPTPSAGPGGAGQSMNNVVLWRRDTWTLRDAGRVQIVDDDTGYHRGRRFTWDRFATWALLQRHTDGAVVSVVSVHHMTNPDRFPRQHGDPPSSRAEQYGAGMDILLRLRDALAAHGPVLIGGDMNTHASYTDLPWSAAAKMSAAGYGWYHHGVDFIFYPHGLGVRLVRGWSGTMVSDHHWVAARVAMNGVGPETTHQTVDRATASAGAGGAVVVELMRLRYGPEYPTITVEQAINAVTIAVVARDLRVPRDGLQIAVAAAIQESKLVNLPGGDRDSGGLFQQRPSEGWGTRAQIRDPVLATEAFFGRADHTDNTGLLDIPGWQRLSVAQAAQLVQHSAHPQAYARWEHVAGVIADVLGGDLPALAGDVTTAAEEGCAPTGIQVGCAVDAGQYNLGSVTPELERLVAILAPMFDIETVGGYRESATDPDGHPAGLAADFMVPMTSGGRAQGDRLVSYAQVHARELGVDYLIWQQRIWSVGRAEEGWRSMEDRGSPTQNHEDHVHASLKPGAVVQPVGLVDACEQVVYPVPDSFAPADLRNWRQSGSRWSSWHTGTDFPAPCGTPVYAAHAGIVQVGTTQSWAGPWLVQVSSGPGALTTWYAHLQTLTAARGETVQPGQQIGVVGREGNATGCHLHFEVHVEGGPLYGPDNVDPSTWLRQHISTSAA